MNKEALLQAAQSILAPWAVEARIPESNRLDVVIDASNLLAAVTALHDARWGYLSAITGLDLGVEKAQIEILYQFCNGPVVVSLRVQTPRTSAQVLSICSVIPSASFQERELAEMFGVNVIGTPDSDHLYLPDDWPEGAFPLRKDFGETS